MAAQTYLLSGVMIVAGAFTAALSNISPSLQLHRLPFSMQGGNSIGGHVYDPSHRPVAQVRVELLDEVDSVLATTRTDGTGHYVFRSLSAGTFQVRVLTDGTNYASQTERVTITNFSRRTPSGGTAISGAEYVQKDFTLRLREDASTSPTGPAGTVFAQNVPDEARRIYEKAVADLDGGKNEEQGLAGLKKAIDLFPNYYLALERLGNEYARRNQFESARLVLTRAVEINPSGQRSQYLLGVTLYRLKQFSAAIEPLRQSVALAPNSINSHMWLGLALLKDGQLDQAENHLKRAYALGGKRIPEVHMHLAQMYSNSKRYREAADELELFLKEAPDARDAENIKKLIKQLREKAR